MRRFMIALLGTAFGTTLLVGAKANEAPAGTAVADAALDPAAATSGIVPTVTVGPDGNPTTVAVSPTVTGPGATTPGSGPSASRSAGSSPTVRPSTSTTTAATSTTYTGVAVAVRTAQSPTTKSSACGECANYSISVTITVSAGRITAASASYNPSPGGSQQYANSASNSLKQTILTAQTWNLGRVSGATYAGNAWGLSAKDAMAKAGLPT